MRRGQQETNCLHRAESAPGIAELAAPHRRSSQPLATANEHGREARRHPAFDKWQAMFSAGFTVAPPDGRHDHQPLDLSANELLERLQKPPIGPKGSAGYFLAAEFEAGKRSAADLSGDPAFVVLDLDTGNFDAASIRLALDSIAHVAYTTASHKLVTTSNPKGEARWRLLVPIVGARLNSEEHRALARWLHRDVLGEDANFADTDAKSPDRCGERLTQPMFWPTVESADQPYEVVDSLDFPPLAIDDMERMVREVFAEDEAKKQAETASQSRRRSQGGDVIVAYNEAHSVEDLFVEYDYKKGRGGKWIHPFSTSRKPSEVIFKDSGRWYSHRGSSEGTEWQRGDAFDLFRLFQHDGDAKAAVRAAAEDLGIGRGDNLPSIQTSNREAREVVSDILGAVAKANAPPRLFSRIGGVVRVARNDLGVGEAQRVQPADMLNVVSAAANFTRWDRRAGAAVIARPPKDIYAAAFARMSVEDILPRLRSVTPTPIISEDGTIIDNEGYDPTTRAYFAPRDGFTLGRVPLTPTDSEAQRAVETLMAPFREMPFAKNADAANFLALLVTVVIRQWFQCVPFGVIEAPIQGSGKTLAAMAMRVIAEGTAGIAAAPEAGNQGDAEWRKRITSALLTAPSVVIFDNVTGTLGGASLAAVATSPVWSDRLLGTNDSPDLPNTPTWLFTSNNAQVDADLLRRCMFVRLDPGVPTPHLRSGFSIPDLIAHLEHERGEILAAIYTIVRRWITLGKPGPPDGTPVLGSYEKWSRTVPAILGAVGISGVLGDIDERGSMMKDPDEEDLLALLDAWWTHFPELRERAPARALVDASINGDAPGRASLPLPGSLNGDAKPAVLARSLGKWMKFRRDRIVETGDGFAYAIRLGGGDYKRGFQWNVERTESGRAS